MLQTLGVLITISLIIFMASRKVGFGLAIILGSLIISIFSGISPDRFLRSLISVLQSLSTYELVLDVALIGVLGYVLKETELITELIYALRRILPGRALIALIPAIFGVMPMPGGALVSAPLIDKEATELGLSPEKKSFANLWFRHMWDFVLPIQPAMILAASLAEVDLYSLIILQIPAFVFMILLGFLFLLNIRKTEKQEEEKVSYRSIILGIAPILIAVALNIIGVWLPIALSLGILTIFIIKGRFRNAPSMIKKEFNKGPIIAVFSVMFFRAIIEESQAFREIL